MQLAKLTSKGQITLPKEVRAILKVKEGDKVVFMPAPNGFTVANANMIALKQAQKSFKGVAKELGLNTIEDVTAMVKSVRKEMYESNN
jgi:AbrB family looped-hinge helix DNA binding protein